MHDIEFILVYSGVKGRWRATHRGNDLDTAAHKPNQNLGVDFFELLSTNVSSLCRNFCAFGFLALSVLFIVRVRRYDFCKINSEGVRKALKKYDKAFKASGSDLQARCGALILRPL